MLNNLLTIKEAADIFSVKESTVYSWIRRKNFPQEVILKIGATIRLRKLALETFINGV